jgi:hypothetical protein
LTSFDQTSGIKYLTRTILNLAMSVNGFDDVGHYLRTTLLAGCNSLATTLNQACSANFVNGSSTAPSAAAASKPRSTLARLLAGEDPNKVMADYRRRHPGKKLPNLAAAAPAGGKAAPAAAAPKKKAKPSASSGGSSSDGMLNYLLGNGQ